MVYDIVSILCIAVMLALSGYFLVKCAILPYEARFQYLKSFKKGKFLALILVLIPLFSIAEYYRGTAAHQILFVSIKSIVDTLVLKFTFSSVEALMVVNPYFMVAVLMAYSLAVVNACLFLFALVGQGIGNAARLWRRKHSRKTLYVVVGYNKNALTLIKSIKGKAVVFAQLEADDKKNLYAVKCAYKKVLKGENVAASVLRYAGNLTRRRAEVIVIGKNDDDAYLCVRNFITDIKEKGLEQYSANKGKGICIRVFASPSTNTAFESLSERSDGTVRHVDKYKLIADDFIERYPITLYMDKTYLDYENAVLRQDVDVNFVMIGFGKTNRELFSRTISAWQFVAKEGQKTVARPIRYITFDREKRENDLQLNHNFFRYTQFLENRKGINEGYLPFAPLPAVVDNKDFGIESQKFYETLKAEIQNKEGRRSFNYVAVAFGSDTENLDFAKKLRAEMLEWELAKNTYIFVKIRDKKLADCVEEEEQTNEHPLRVFACENVCVYNLEALLQAQTYEIAIARDQLHLIEKASRKQKLSEEEKKTMKETAKENWHQLTNLKRLSNVSAGASLRQKLHMLGLDYAKAEKGLTLDDYLEKIGLSEEKYTRDGDYIQVKYELDEKGEKRKNIAISEHLRWNAYSVCCGVLPCTKDEIKKKTAEELAKERKHACLTTFEGLEEYRKIMAEKNGTDEFTEDVIQYDYQLLDSAYSLLKLCDKKLVERE